MIGEAISFVIWAALRITLASLFLLAGARLARVRKRSWARAWLCAAMLLPVSLAALGAASVMPLVGGPVGLAATAAIWLPVIAGAFDTTWTRAAAVLATALLVYPGWTFGY
jgi:hypothetical protein